MFGDGSRLRGRERLADLVERAVFPVGERPEMRGEALVLPPRVLDQLSPACRKGNSFEEGLQSCTKREHSRRVPGAAV